MKTSPLLAAVSAVVIVSLQLPATARAADSDQAELIKIEQTWGDGLLKRDRSVLDRLEAADFTVTGPDGKLSTKKEDLKSLTTGPVFTAFKLHDLKVRLYGDAAVVTGISSVKGHLKERDVSGDYRFTDVFVKRGGEWKAEASHVSKVDNS